MAAPIEQLQAMRHLQENWDGYGAAAPLAHVIDLGQEFVRLLDAMLRKSPDAGPLLHVSPTRIGGILVEWEDRSQQHEVEIKPDGAISMANVP